MTCVLDECQQGHKPCPDPAVCCGSTRRVSPEELTRRTQEAEYLWTRGIGVEAADAARVTGTPIVTDELRPVREPWWRLPPLGARKPLPPTTAWEWVGFCGVAALIGLWVWIVRG